jgi:hypothetical protein
MARIEEELVFAKQAKAAFEGKPTRKAVEVLRKAYRMAATQPAFLGEGPLRDARGNVGVALLLVIIGLEQGQKNRGDINKAKSAIDAWIKELETYENQLPL